MSEAWMAGYLRNGPLCTTKCRQRRAALPPFAEPHPLSLKYFVRSRSLLCFLWIMYVPCKRNRKRRLVSHIIYLAVGIISSLPVPRYTLTSPSPLAAEPIKLLPERSTVKFKEPLHAITKLPSTFSTSSFSSISMSSSHGQSASRQKTPLPFRRRTDCCA